MTLLAAARRSLALALALALAACSDGPTDGLGADRIEPRVLDSTFGPGARIEDLQGDRLLVSDGPELWLVDLETFERRRLTRALEDSDRVSLRAELSESGVAYVESNHVVFESLVDGARAEVEWSTGGYEWVPSAFVVFNEELIIRGERVLRLELATLETSELLDGAVGHLANLGGVALFTLPEAEPGGWCLYDGTAIRCCDGPPDVGWTNTLDGKSILLRSERDGRRWLCSMTETRELPEGLDPLALYPHSHILCGRDGEVGLVSSVHSESGVWEVDLRGGGDPVTISPYLNHDGCLFLRGRSLTYAVPGQESALTVEGVQRVGGSVPWVAIEGRLFMLRGGAMVPLEVAPSPRGSLEPVDDFRAAVWSTYNSDGSSRTYTRIDVESGAVQSPSYTTPRPWARLGSNSTFDVFFNSSSQPGGIEGLLLIDWASGATTRLGFVPNTSLFHVRLDRSRVIVLSAPDEAATELELRVVTSS